MNRLLVCLLFGLLVGCAPGIETLPVTGAERFSIQAVAQVGAVGPMAVSADGRMVAWGDDGLQLRDSETNQQLRLLDGMPETLCWSPDGTLLAATISTGKVSRLKVFDQSGRSIYELELGGRVTRLQWSLVGGLMAGVMEHETFKFGTHVAEQLLRWDERWHLSEIPLYETTLMPNTAAQLDGRLHQTFDFDLSPLGDELLYTRVNAPPAFSASRYLVLLNLETGQERQIAELPLLSGTGRLAANGESALIADGRGQVRMQDMWSDRILGDWTGEYFDYDASSELLIADGRLYRAHDLLLELPDNSRAQLSHDGHFLLIRWNGHLYLLSSYPVTKAATVAGAKLVKLQKLRRLRSRGMIEQKEYQQTRERLLQ